jgi:hypothetical protein
MALTRLHYIFLNTRDTDYKHAALYVLFDSPPQDFSCNSNMYHKLNSRIDGNGADD